MKLPRGVSGEGLVSALQKIGYESVRRNGSHVRLRHPGPPVHLITVPLHHALKTGMLHAIVAEVAQMRSLSIESIVEKI